MPVIDADAHVIENESAWDYMLESERQFRPKIVGAANGDPSADFWLIDGGLIPGGNLRKKLPPAGREMGDLRNGARPLDQLNVGNQVIYPKRCIFRSGGGPELDPA